VPFRSTGSLRSSIPPVRLIIHILLFVFCPLLLIVILQDRTVSDASKVKRSVTMNNPNDETNKSTTSAATTARPSTVPTRSKGGSTKSGKSKKPPATHAAAGQLKEADAKNPAPSNPSAPKVQVKPPPPGGAAKGAAARAVPPATAVVVDDSVAATVRALLETDLASETGPTKVVALRALAGYFRPVKEGSPADKRWEPFRRAAVQENGCRKVLDVLHQELAKTGASGGGGGTPGPNRDAVGAALRFLESWNARSPEHRTDASRHGGARAIVGAMRAFPYNSAIQRKALACIRTVAVEDAGAGPRLRALVEADAMLQVSRAMMAHPRDVELRTLSIRILGRLREHGNDRIYDLYKSEAGEYLSMLCFMYGESDDPEDEELEYILRELVLEMLE
jgi:hypothetical protein